MGIYNRVQRTIRIATHTESFFFFLVDKEGVVLTLRTHLREFVLLSSEECRKTTIHSPTYVWLGFTFWFFTSCWCLPTSYVCGLGYISLSNSNLSYLEMDLQRGPKNSWLSGVVSFTLSFLYSLLIQVMVFSSHRAYARSFLKTLSVSVLHSGHGISPISLSQPTSLPPHPAGSKRGANLDSLLLLEGSPHSPLSPQVTQL